MILYLKIFNKLINYIYFKIESTTNVANIQKPSVLSIIKSKRCMFLVPIHPETKIPKILFQQIVFIHLCVQWLWASN